MTCRRGYTLIELLLVLAIIGILAGLVMLSLGNTNSNVTHGSLSDEVLSRMRFLQEQAISDGQERRVTFLLNNNQVRFYATSAEASEIRSLRIVLPPGVTFQNGTSLNVFLTRSGHIRTTAGYSTLLGGSARMRCPGQDDLYIIWYQTGRIRLSNSLD
jgi:prepilin-type N-terminal cleavage/methylation domain-containing protein